MKDLPKATGVIVADDDTVIRNVMRAGLEAIDQHVLLAKNGQEAIDIATETQVGLVLLDVNMPVLDGLSACARIRALPGYADTPIVMLTVDDSEKTQAAASKAGATMFLPKPFGAATLMLKLSRFLSLDDATLQVLHDNAVRAAGGRVFRRMHT